MRAVAHPNFKFLTIISKFSFKKSRFEPLLFALSFKTGFIRKFNMTSCLQAPPQHSFAHLNFKSIFVDVKMQRNITKKLKY